MVIGHSAQGAAGAGFLEKQRQQGDHGNRHQGGDEVVGVDQQAAGKHAFQDEDRLGWQAQIDGVDVAAKNGLAKAVDEEGDAQRGHEQHHTLLVHQMSQHQAFDRPSKQEHDEGGYGKSQDVGQQQALKAQPFGQPFGKARHRQRGKQHHRALSEVEHARGFENEHEAQGYQRIEHAVH